MGARRKGNPRFHLGEDKRGRRSWRLNPSAQTSDAGDLRLSVSDIAGGDVLVSALEAQLDPYDVESMSHAVDNTTRASMKGPLRFLHDSPLLPFAGATGGVVAAAVGLPFLAAPLFLVAAVSAFGVQSNLVRRWARRSAKKKMRRVGEFRDESDSVVYRKEGEKLVGSFRRWDGPNDEEYVGALNGVYVNGSQSNVSCSVSREGLGEVNWETERALGLALERGRMFFYPGVNVEEKGFPFPVRLPGVNAQGALMEYTKLSDGSVLDGADLRGLKARGASWAASLVGANFQDADLREVRWDRCDVSGANFEGADLTGAQLPSDLTSTDITREQFESLADITMKLHRRDGYRVKEVSVGEVRDVFGGDIEALTGALWSGGVEVRERGTNEVVVGAFDPAEHYIPAWATGDVARAAERWVRSSAQQ